MTEATEECQIAAQLTDGFPARRDVSRHLRGEFGGRKVAVRALSDRVVWSPEARSGMASWAHGRRLATAWVLTVAAIVGGGCAARQPARSFLDLQERLHPGNTVYVTDTAGTETKGKVVEVSAAALVLDVKGAPPWRSVRTGSSQTGTQNHKSQFARRR